ncbi:MAG TPA: DUF4142 domain-containing protein [Steroidobacteraceae bacterium]|nr:DUF4142 domain-containing protein [Steroidobacteraceae bacterium]
MALPVALLMLLAGPQQDQTTLPRHPDPDPVEGQAHRDGTPTDPWFDRDYVATDDPAFILAAVENARQGEMDAQAAAKSLGKPGLVAAAQKIGEQNAQTSRKLEQLAASKGWRLPKDNPGRDSTSQVASSARAGADFIINQITFHENTLAQYRAQIAGKGDADLKRALREALPGYQRNLELLLQLEP